MCLFKVGDYKFVTVDDQGLVGSIYFANGRIRLLHEFGPQVSLEIPVRQEVRRHPVTDPAGMPIEWFVQDMTVGRADAILEIYEQAVKDAAHANNPDVLAYAEGVVHPAVVDFKTMLPETEKKGPAAVGAALLQVAKHVAVVNYLYEDLGDGWEHASRGVPARIPFTLNQAQLDGLCGAIDGLADLKKVQKNDLLYEKIELLKTEEGKEEAISKLLGEIDHSVDDRKEDIIKAANKVIYDVCSSYVCNQVMMSIFWFYHNNSTDNHEKSIRKSVKFCRSEHLYRS